MYNNEYYVLRHDDWLHCWLCNYEIHCFMHYLIYIEYILESYVSSLKSNSFPVFHYHYSDVIMRTMASEITGVSIVYSTVCSGADQRKHQSTVSLASLRGIYRWFPHKGPVTRKMFPLDHVIRFRTHGKYIAQSCYRLSHLSLTPEMFADTSHSWLMRNKHRWNSLQIDQANKLIARFGEWLIKIIFDLRINSLSVVAEDALKYCGAYWWWVNIG